MFAHVCVIQNMFVLWSQAACLWNYTEFLIRRLCVCVCVCDTKCMLSECCLVLVCVCVCDMKCVFLFLHLSFGRGPPTPPLISLSLSPAVAPRAFQYLTFSRVHSAKYFGKLKMRLLATGQTKMQNYTTHYMEQIRSTNFHPKKCE